MKDPLRDRPRKLWWQRVNPALGEKVSAPIGNVTGPGVLLVVARPVKPSLPAV